MEELSAFKRNITFQMLLTAAVAAAGSLLLGYPAVAKGFVLGSFFSLFNFLIMVRGAFKRVGQDRKAATASSGLSIVLRLALLGLPLIMAFNTESLSLAATIVGILNLQISILIYGLVIERFGSMNSRTAEGR